MKVGALVITALVGAVTSLDSLVMATQGHSAPDCLVVCTAGFIVTVVAGAAIIWLTDAPLKTE